MLPAQSGVAGLAPDAPSPAYLHANDDPDSDLGSVGMPLAELLLAPPMEFPAAVRPRLPRPPAATQSLDSVRKELEGEEKGEGDELLASGVGALPDSEDRSSSLMMANYYFSAGASFHLALQLYVDPPVCMIGIPYRVWHMMSSIPRRHCHSVCGTLCQVHHGGAVCGT
jgi:hypothetical protein